MLGTMSVVRNAGTDGHMKAFQSYAVSVRHCPLRSFHAAMPRGDRPPHIPASAHWDTGARRWRCGARPRGQLCGAALKRDGACAGYSSRCNPGRSRSPTPAAGAVGAAGTVTADAAASCVLKTFRDADKYNVLGTLKAVLST